MRAPCRDVLSELEGLGFRGQFVAREAAEVECVACKTRTAAADFASHELRRLEGASDPSDMMIVVGLECPSCGRRGTLVLGYGPEASAADADVARLLDDDVAAHDPRELRRTPSGPRPSRHGSSRRRPEERAWTWGCKDGLPRLPRRRPAWASRAPGPWPTKVSRSRCADGTPIASTPPPLESGRRRTRSSPTSARPTEVARSSSRRPRRWVRPRTSSSPTPADLRLRRSRTRTSRRTSRRSTSISCRPSACASLRSPRCASADGDTWSRSRRSS